MSLLGTINSTTEMAGLGSSPVELKISTASKGGIFKAIDQAVGDVAITASGFIEDEKFNLYMDRSQTAVSAEFDSAVKRTGKLTLLLQSTNTSGICDAYQGYVGAFTESNARKYAIPAKASTTYRYSCWVKTAGVGANGAYISANTIGTNWSFLATYPSNKLTGTNDWTLCTVTFATPASFSGYIYISFDNAVAGTVSSAWFDVNSAILEEVVTDTSYTGATIEKIRPIFQGVTTTDNIDKSADTGGAFANTYTLTTGVSELAADLLTFTPTKRVLTQIGVWVVAKGTGNWTMALHDASNNALAVWQILVANITNGQFLYFPMPYIWTTGALHIHIFSSVADGTVKTNTANDFSTASYIQRYAKRTNGATVIVNGVKSELRSGKDGILDTAIIDIDKGKYLYDSGNIGITTATTLWGFGHNVYENSDGSQTSGSRFINRWNAQTNCIETLNGGTDRYLTVKVSTILPIKHLKFIAAYGAYTANASTLEVSSDNVNWTTVETRTDAANENPTQTASETEVMNGLSYFFIRFHKAAAVNDYFNIKSLRIEADLDTTKVQQGLFYPLATNRFAETTKIPAVATRVYFRLAKFVNQLGRIVPALEFTDTTPTTIGYMPLRLDNSQEANPCVDILTGTTSWQQSGTGSNDGSTGYILNDGEYMTFSPTVSEIKVDYKVGTGTTTFANITKNTIFHHSNGYIADSTQGPSHTMTAILGVRQQSINERVANLGQEVANLQSAFTPSFGGMYEDNGSSVITVTVGGTFYGWVTASQGQIRGMDIDLTNATSDRLIIRDEGIYFVTYSLSAAGSKSELMHTAAFKKMVLSYQMWPVR